MRLTHVPYKGPAPVVTAVLGGEVPIGIGASPAVLPMVQAKRVVPLAVTSLNRLGAAPAIPTIAESAVPGFQVTNNHGILAPAGTPARIVKALNAEIQAMLLTEDAEERDCNRRASNPRAARPRNSAISLRRSWHDGHA